MPIILAITGGVCVLAIGGFLTKRYMDKISTPPVSNLESLPYATNVFKDQEFGYNALSRRESVTSTGSLAKETTALFPPTYQDYSRRGSVLSNSSVDNPYAMQFSDLASEDVFSLATPAVQLPMINEQQSGNLFNSPGNLQPPATYTVDYSHNLANAALRMASNDSAKHTSSTSTATSAVSRISGYSNGSSNISGNLANAALLLANQDSKHDSLSSSATFETELSRNSLKSDFQYSVASDDREEYLANAALAAAMDKHFK
ncbi:hypothetical protein HDV01_005160 [Terramyces sp. JEL0728]|nr:hypothetical protein HDV01_005160 [Terramyces sp. JEL0728]